MSSITTSMLTAYVSHRLDQGAASATINKELAVIRRAFRLALQANELVTMPHVPLMKLNNARKGFFDRRELDAILTHLPDHLHGLLRFAYITGWRVSSEVLPLTVDRVDLDAGVVLLDPGTTKNEDGRCFHFTTELRQLLETQLASLDALKEKGVISPYVFHRPNGKQIKHFRKVWETACEAAGYPGKLLHDFRRTAVRNLERAGVPRSTAMAMVGHKTESIYRRYAIQDETTMREGAAKLDAWSKQHGTTAASSRVKTFKRAADGVQLKVG